MHNDSDFHPPETLLSAFSRGLLADAEHHQVEEHLIDCLQCQELLTSLPEDSFSKLFRNPVALSLPERKIPVSGYEILGELGRGGMGVVYRARDRKLNRVVALKKIRNGSLANREEQTRFLREAEIVARLVHPGIVQIYEVGHEIGEDGLPIPYFAMELIEGETLADRLSRGPLSTTDTVNLIEQLARAIHCAHEHKILHRDVKPANVMLASTDPQLLHPKITDFGLAKLLQKPTSQTVMSQAGTILGTPGYIAPEQVRDLELTPACDVYSLGCIFYECITGRTPFGKELSWMLLQDSSRHDAVSPRRLQPDLPRELESICLKCLESAPSRRYQSAEALAEDLARFRRHEPIMARPAGKLEKVAKWIRRHPWPATILLLLLLATILAFFGLTLHNVKLQTAFNRVAIEKQRADEHYQLAKETIRRQLSRINELKSRQLDGARELQVKQLEDALRFHETIMHASEGLGPQFDTVWTLAEIGTLQTTLGRHADAEASLKRTIAMLNKMPADDVQVLEHLFVVRNKLGSVLLSTQRPQEAIDCFQQSQSVVKQLQKLFPQNRKYEDDLAWCHHNAGVAYFVLGKMPEAKEEYEQAIKLRKAQTSDNLEWRGRLAESLSNLAMIIHRQGDRAKALELYQEAEHIIREQRRALPEALHEVSLAAVLLNKGNLLGENGKLEQVLQIYQEGIVMLNDVLKREPQHSTAKHYLLALHGASANVLDATGQSPAALPHWDQVVALDPQLVYRCYRARSLAQAGQHSQFLAALDQLKGEACTGDQLWLLCQATAQACKEEAGKSSSPHRTALKQALNRLCQQLQATGDANWLRKLEQDAAIAAAR